MASWPLRYIVLLLLCGLVWADPPSHHQQVLSMLLKTGFINPSSKHGVDAQLSHLVTEGFLQLGNGLMTHGNVFAVNTTVPRACVKADQDGLLLCTTVGNQAYAINEWLVYHLWVAGVNHIVLYDDNSTDNLHDVLQPWVQTGLITLQAALPGIDNQPMQTRSHGHCVEQYAKKYKWVSNVDLDEWLFPIQQPCIPDALEQFADTAGISVMSAHAVGSDYLARRDSRTAFQATDYLMGYPHPLVKPVCLVKHVHGFAWNMPHCCNPREGFSTVNEKLQPSPAGHECWVAYNTTREEPRTVIQLFHYQGVSLEERINRHLVGIKPTGAGFGERQWGKLSILSMYETYKSDVSQHMSRRALPSDSIRARMEAFEHVLNSVLPGRATVTAIDPLHHELSREWL